ncbi:MAG: quinone-dependent dihydroorotate dehydrogenase [Bdellovibrionota bacterium]
MWNNFKSFLFNFDAEKVHDLSVETILRLGNLSPLLLETASGHRSDLSYPVKFLGKTLHSPLGLAAGFDKNALLVPYLPALGFSFAEIGSVTLRAQSGNTKPRLFRGDDVLFNRMGFNNDGAECVARRLESYSNSPHFLLGVNIGLNKETPHEKAPEEYAETFKILSSYGDYFVINVSSPNTPGLRDLQEVSEIEKIFSKLKAHRSDKPLYLKLASEVSIETREEFYRRASEMGIDGFVLTNTLKGEREGLVGGWSGECLRLPAREALLHARQHTKLPLISVGGIMDVDEAIERLRLGASLIQIYTGWIFRGPRFPSQINERYAREFSR